MPKQSQNVTEVQAPQGHQSITRAMALLRAVAQKNETGVRLTTLANEVGLHVATVRRILQALTEEGMLTYNPTTKLYHLGFELYLLGKRAQHYTLRNMLRPALEKISEETQDCVFLLIRSGYEVLCIDMVSGAYPVKTMLIETGSRRPLGTGAGSLAILTSTSTDEFEKILKSNAPLYMKYRGLTTDDIRKMAEETLARGYGVSDEVFHAGVVSIGVPIMDKAGNNHGAITLSAISSRMNEERQKKIVSLIRRHTAEHMDSL